MIAYGDVPLDRVDEPTVEPTAFGPGEAKSPVAAPVRIGLVGPGSFASRVLVPALVAGGATLEAVGGGAGPSAAAAARTLGFSRVAESEAALVADTDTDAIVVATRHESHASLVSAALDAGKHVFCEKPLALTAEELERVILAATGSRGTLAVGFNRRFAPLLRRAREHVGAGGGPVVATYRVSAGTLPDDHWTHDLAQGGGRLLGEGCHFVDSLVFLTGSPVRSVYAAGYGAPERPLQARDNVCVTLGFENGSVGTILYVADGSPKVPKERVEAFAGQRTAILDDYVTLSLFGPAGQETVKGGAQDKGHAAEVEAFLGGVTSGTAPVALGEIANVSLATLAIVESLRTGRAVAIGRLPSAG